MITGQLPFKGEYERAMLYSIMSEEPEPINDLKPDLPIELEDIVNKTLQKNKEDRYQSAEEMLIDLQQVQLDIPTISSKKPIPKMKKPHPVKTKKPNTSRLLYLGLAMVLAIFVIISIFYRKKEIGKIPRTEDIRITYSGNTKIPVISPDSKFLASAFRDSSGMEKVLVQDITVIPPTGQAIEIFSDNTIQDIRWSPNGAELLISSLSDSTAGSYIVPRLGGTSQQLAAFGHKCWSPDGSRIAFISGVPTRINFLNRADGDTSSIALKGLFEEVRDIDWSSSGNLILFLNWSKDWSEIWVIKADNGQQVAIVKDTVSVYCPRWSPTGDAIYYTRYKDAMPDLMKIKVSPATGQAKGEAVIVQPRVNSDFFSISKVNQSMVYSQFIHYSNLWSVTLTNNNFSKEINTKQLTTGTSIAVYPNLSPDEKSIAFSKGSVGQTNIFILPINGGQERQLTYLFRDLNLCPVWSPDGQKIAFFSSRDAWKFRVWMINSQGGTPRLFERTEVHAWGYIAWAPGKEILYQRQGRRNYHFLNPITEQQRPLVLNDSVGWMYQLCYSPDNKKVAVYWDREPAPGLWLISLEDSSQVLLNASSVLRPIKWSADGNYIYARKHS